MAIKVMCFGQLKEVLGQAEFTIEFTESMKVQDVFSQIVKDDNGIKDQWQNKVLYAVNQVHEKPDTLVKDGDEVALMPPMAGG